MPNQRTIVLGGGLAGLSAAYALADRGWTDIVVLEKGVALGGLAGSFQIGNRHFPLGYHHILGRDRPLHFFLHRINALQSVQWRKIRMLFETASDVYDLANVFDFLRFPMSVRSKFAFARLMVRAYAKENWADWDRRSGAELLDGWANRNVRETLFDPLVRLKFDLPSSAISAAWLGSRLHFREGSDALGFMPGTNWTTVLCDGMARLIADRGVTVRTAAEVAQLRTVGGRVTAAVMRNGDEVAGEIFINTLPAHIYTSISPEDRTKDLASIRYTALLSLVCGGTQIPDRDFYWMNLASERHTASAIFNLTSLNPTIAEPGETCWNLVRHLSSPVHPMFRRSDRDVIDSFLDDFKRILGFELTYNWLRLSRIPVYSPVFVIGYAPIPTRSESLDNVYFAGNYCLSPSIASTGTALQSGLLTATQILRDHRDDSDLAVRASQFHIGRRA